MTTGFQSRLDEKRGSRHGAKPTYAGQRFVCRARITLNQIGHAAKDVGTIRRAEESFGTLAIQPYSEPVRQCSINSWQLNPIGSNLVAAGFIRLGE